MWLVFFCSWANSDQWTAGWWSFILVRDDVHFGKTATLVHLQGGRYKCASLAIVFLCIYVVFVICVNCLCQYNITYNIAVQAPVRSRYHRSLLARGCTCFQLFSVQTIALHWTKPNFCRYRCWLFYSYMKWADSEQTDICCWPSMWVMLHLHNRWLGTSYFNISQYGFSFGSFGKNWHFGVNDVSDRGTNVRFASKPFLHGGNLSLKSTSELFSSLFLGHCSSVFLRQWSFVFLGHCSSVFLRHGSGVLLRHSRRSNCISIDPFCIPASISQFSTALIILNCNADQPTNR